LAIRQRLLGPEHPDTLQSRKSLNILLTTPRKQAEAEATHRATLNIRVSTLGFDHPDTLQC